MIAAIKIVAAMTGLAFYLLFNKGCCSDNPACGRGLFQCAWTEIRDVLGLD